MYHPGKVIEVLSKKNTISADSSVQAVLEMWDENVLTMLVDPKIAAKVKKGNFVLVDYRPQEKVPAPRHVVVKVLSPAEGRRIWNRYKEFLATKKERAAIRTIEPPSRRYIG